MKLAACAECGATYPWSPRRQFCSARCRQARRWRDYRERWRVSCAGRVCKACMEYKPASEFNMHGEQLRSRCRSCELGADKRTEREAPHQCARCRAPFIRQARSEKYCSLACRQQAWRESNRWTSIRRRYGLTREQWEQMHFTQDGRCAICNDLDENLNVDHRHADGLVRGLLCWRCNAAIGHMREDTAALLRAVAYLRRHAEVAA